jgi:hypothetical protein
MEELQDSGVNAAGFRFTISAKEQLIDGLVLALGRHELLIPVHADLLRNVEEQRQDLLQRLSNQLTIPFTTPSGSTVWDLADLEIGHIAYQINRNGMADWKTRQHVNSLRDIRNLLVHFKVVSAATLDAVR